MKKWFILVVLGLLWVNNCEAYGGAGFIMAYPKGYFLPLTFNGDSTGFGRARDRCLAVGGGMIQVGPGNENTICTYPAGAHLIVIKASILQGYIIDPLFGSGGGGGGTDTTN